LALARRRANAKPQAATEKPMPRLNPFASGRAKLTKLWDANIDGHVIALAWSHALGLIAVASADGPIALFDAKTGQVRHHLLGHGFGTSDVAWSADGKLLASAGQDGKVRLWDPATGLQTKEMAGGAAWVERVAWCPTANILASAAGKKLRLWNADGTMVREFPDHPTTIADIRWKPTETVLASTAYGKLFLWSSEQQDAVREFAWQGSMLVLAWSPNGQYIAAGAQDCTVHFWLMKTGKDLMMAGYPTKIRELAWDAPSRFLATGGGPVSCVWDCSGKGPAGTTPIQLEGHEDNITCLAYQHQGTYLASGGEDGLLALWQPSKQHGSLALAKHPSAVSQLAWSTDDKRLAVATADGAVLLYTI
jgi:WD40 repeat protein